MAVHSQRRDSQSPEGSGRRRNSVSHSYSEFLDVCDVDSAGHWWLIEPGERARESRPPRAFGYIVPQDEGSRASRQLGSSPGVFPTLCVEESEGGRERKHRHIISE